MTLKPYPEYCDAGRDWMGKIPAHWKTAPVKRVARVNPTSGGVRSMPGSTDVSILPMEHVGEWGGLNLSKRSMLSEVNTGLTYMRDGDVIVAKITPCFENGKGALCSGLANGIGFGSTEFHVLRPSLSELDGLYLYYLTRSAGLRDFGTASMEGAGGQKRVPTRWLATLGVPLPSLDEQRQIARFLDYKTRQTGRLLHAKRRLIALLNEQKQAIIQRAVTRGLDPDVRLKPSGVDWLGEVPAHWEVRRIKQLSRVVRGRFNHRPRNDATLYNGPYPFIQTGDVARAVKLITEHTQSLNEKGLAVSKLFPEGTLVMTIAANIGDLAILTFEACFPDSVVGFVPRKQVERSYLYYALKALKPEFLREAPVNTQGNLNIERIGQLQLVLPALLEQKHIVDALEETTASIDSTIIQARREIDLIREYRARLIADVVTGKLDVRGVAVPEVEDAEADVRLDTADGERAPDEEAFAHADDEDA